MAVEFKGAKGQAAKVEVQDFDFSIYEDRGRNLVVPDSLSRDVGSKTVYQPCYQPLKDEPEEVCSFKEVTSSKNGSTVENI